MSEEDCIMGHISNRFCLIGIGFVILDCTAPLEFSHSKNFHKFSRKSGFKLFSFCS